MASESYFIYSVTGDPNRMAIEANRLFAGMYRLKKKKGYDLKFEFDDGTCINGELLIKDNDQERVEKHLDGLHAFYEGVSTEKAEVKRDLLFHISVFNCILELQCEFRDPVLKEKIEQVLFDVTEKMKGAVLFPNMSIYTGSGSLILSEKGESEQDTYEPNINTDFFIKKFFMTNESENQERRERTMKRLKALGLSCEKPIPMNINYAEVGIRVPEQVYERVCGLNIVCTYAASVVMGKEFLDFWWKEIHNQSESGLDPFAFSLQKEKDYMFAKNVPKRVHAQYFWQIESCVVLLWSLGLMELPPPNVHTELAAILNKLSNFYPENFDLDNMYPDERVRADILDEADFAFNCDWACRDMERRKIKIPDTVDPEIIMFRCFAFAWMIGIYQEWTEDLE